MGLNVHNVLMPTPDQSDTTGAIQLAKVGVTAPTDAVTALSTSDWSGENSGYVGSDGVTVSGLVAAGDAVRDWSLSRIRTTKGEAEPTIQIPAISIDKFLCGLMLQSGDYTYTAANATHGNQLTMKFSGDVGPANALTINMKDEDRRVRLFAPSAQVTDCDDLTLVPSDVLTVALTLSLNADDNGHYLYFFFDDGQVVAA